MYLVSVLVCWQCEYITFPLPFRLNEAIIDPFRRIPPTTFVHTSWASFAWATACNMSSPQRDFTCFHMFPVDCASFLSRNWHIIVLQPRVHLNWCARHPSCSMIWGLGSKNAYTGETHSFISRTIVWLMYGFHWRPLCIPNSSSAVLISGLPFPRLVAFVFALVTVNCDSILR